MERTYLVELIKSLNAEEQADFQKFIANEYFNAGKQHSEVRDLLRIILAAAPDFLEAQLNKEVVYPQVFPDSPVMVEGKLEKLMVELNKLLRTFLLIRYYFREKNEIQHQLDLGAILRERQLENRYQQLLAKTKSMLDAEPWKSAQHFYCQYQLELAFHELESIYNRQKGDLNLSNVLYNLDLFYYINRVEYLNRFLLQQKAANLTVPEPISFALRENPVPERYLKDSTTLLIADKIFYLYKAEHPEVADFQALADLLTEYEDKIEPEVLRYFFTYLRSLCTLLNNLGNQELLPVLHRIQRDNLERGYLYFNGKISPSALINVIIAGIRMKNFQWVEHVLETHKDRIYGDNETQDFYRYNKANYLFAIGKYEEALDWIPPTSPYVDYLVLGRRLELKILYELDSDLLPYKLDALKMFISRASKKFLSDDLRRANADFVNLLNQIIQSKPGDKNRAQQLLQRIEAKKWTAERIWLEEKVKQLR